MTAPERSSRWHKSLGRVAPEELAKVIEGLGEIIGDGPTNPPENRPQVRTRELPRDSKLVSQVSQSH
jgi:hypothetical protein